jgi:glycine/D-amino acid oxidase-like deaminating enzyme/nitrite reductase/ring-hydroxylating ferredoxin subunit
MGGNVSLWEATAPATDHPTVRGVLDVDVAVIGAGVAGATIALFLRREGLDVALVEADRVGRGATGSSTVKVTAAQGLRAHEIARRHGEDVAEAYLRDSQAAVETVASLVDELSIACGFERTTHLVYADDEGTVDALRHELELERRAGIDARWVDEADVPIANAGGIVAGRQATFHPIRYVQGLVSAFETAGGSVYEGSRVVRVDGGDPSVVRTADGELRARHVVIATHYPILDRGLYFARLTPQQEYAVAFRADAGVLRLGPSINTGSPTRSLRLASDDEGPLLVVVGEKHKVGEADRARAHYDSLETWTKDRFGVGDVAYRWTTQDAFTLDALPMIGRYGPGTDRLWVATGFGSWGMTNATIAGRVLTEVIAGRDDPSAGRYSPVRADVVRGMGTFLKENAKVAMHWVGDRMRAGPNDVRELAPGEAAIVDGPDGRVAAFRDAEGTLHTVSAVCTHLGCIVGWNDAERTWDCPCHGSRFGPDGSVIEPPAVTALAPRDL